MATEIEPVDEIRAWLKDGTLTESHLASLLWEHVQASNPKASFGATSPQFPGKRGYVVVFRDYQQAKYDH